MCHAPTRFGNDIGAPAGSLGSVLHALGLEGSLIPSCNGLAVHELLPWSSGRRCAYLTRRGTSSRHPGVRIHVRLKGEVMSTAQAAGASRKGGPVGTMKAAQIPAPGAEFQIVERAIPTPGPGQVRIKVQACGVCHSDLFTKEGAWPGIQYPRIPGHEVVGAIDALGTGASPWQQGQRVGVGWHGGRDGTCRECRRGDFRNCRNLQVPGISYDGGYRQYMVAPVEALVAMPESLDAV